MPKTGSDSAPNGDGGSAAEPTTANAAGDGGSRLVGLAEGLAEGLARGLSAPLDVVVFTRDRLRETLDEAAERGRVTREQANELFVELIRRGRPGGDASRDGAVPIARYDELTARQVCDRLGALRPSQLRALRDYERRHANRKSVLDGIERALG